MQNEELRNELRVAAFFILNSEFCILNSFMENR
jgi:hypothetical protein